MESSKSRPKSRIYHWPWANFSKSNWLANLLESLFAHQLSDKKKIVILQLYAEESGDLSDWHLTCQGLEKVTSLSCGIYYSALWPIPLKATRPSLKPCKVMGHSILEKCIAQPYSDLSCSTLSLGLVEGRTSAESRVRNRPFADFFFKFYLWTKVH